MRCCQLCLLVSLHTHGLRVRGPSNGTLTAPRRRLSVEFMEVATLVASDAAAGDRFGYSVAIDGDTVVVGTYQDTHDGGTNSGSAYVFRTTDGGATYGQVAKLSLSGAHAYRLGTFVAIGGDAIAVSPCWYPEYPDKRATKAALGSVHVFKRLTPMSIQDQTGNASDVSAGGGGDSGAPSFAVLGTDVAIAIFVVVGLLLFATASSLKYRRVRRLLVSDSAGHLTQEQLDRQNDAANVVERAKRFRDVVLAVGSAFPIIGNLMEVVGDLLGSADDFKNDVEGLLIAIRRAERIKKWVELIEQNQCELRVDQEDVETQKELVVKQIRAFNKAMRQFGKQHWCSRICTVQTHISFLLGLDTEIAAEMEALKECYEYARDAHLLQGINQMQTRLEESNEQVLELLRKNSLEALFQQPEVLALWRGLRYFHQDRRGDDIENPLHNTSSAVSGRPRYLLADAPLPPREPQPEPGFQSYVELPRRRRET